MIVGEAERTWPMAIADAAAGRLQSLYRDLQPPSLARLPLARRDLIRGRGLLGNTIIATRGCPHRCSYCNLRQIYDPSLRFRPVEEVVAEVRTFRSPFFTFWDDQLFMDAGYAMKLFVGLAGAGKRWAAMVTLASTRNERLLTAAARAGCSCLFLGLESFSSESLRMANKAFNVVESYQEGIARIHRNNITVQAGIVFGFDGDDESTFEATLRGATRAGLDGATVSILTPFPKTPIFEELQRAGRLLTYDWSYYNGKTAVAFRPARMSAERLWEGYMWFRRLFFAPKCILERVRRSGVRRLQSIILNLGYRRTIANRIPGQPVPSALHDAEINHPRAPTPSLNLAP